MTPPGAVRVQVLPARDPTPSDYCRLIWPAQALAAAGHDVRIDPTEPKFYRDTRTPPTTVPEAKAANIVGLERPDADVVVMHCRSGRHWLQIIPLLQVQGVWVVIDMDNDLENLPSQSGAAARFDPDRNPQANHRIAARACEIADLVTVSTPALAARYGQHGRVHVLPNMIPAHYLTVAHVDRPVLGWAGSASMHVNDLEVTGGAIQNALDDFGWDFWIIGDEAADAGRRFGLRATPPSTGYLSMDDYAAQYASLGAAIVPSTDSVYNKSKSALKMLQAAALGVPVIGSPTADNRRVHALGMGLLADTPQDWSACLCGLLGSVSLRAHLSSGGRAAAAAQTFESGVSGWAAALGCHWLPQGHASLSRADAGHLT